MEVTLLGTGDSTGTPMPRCTCETCELARATGIERSRFSVHIENPVDDAALLIDASPDFRTQFLTHDVSLPDAMIITHIHFDHLDGLGNAYRLVRELPVHAGSEVDPQTGESVAETIRRRYEYLNAITVHPLEPFTTRTVCGLEVELVPVDHPPLACYGVVIHDPHTGGRLAITGDTSWQIPAQSQSRLSDAELLLIDAIVPAPFCEDHPAGGMHETADGTYRTFGRKHLTREGAKMMATRLNPDTYRCVHLSHYYPADEAFEDPMAVDGERYTV